MEMTALSICIEYRMLITTLRVMLMILKASVVSFRTSAFRQSGWRFMFKMLPSTSATNAEITYVKTKNKINKKKIKAVKNKNRK